MLLGIDVISPLSGDWDDQLALVKRGKFEVGKVQIPAGFATAPGHVEQLLEVLAPGPNGRKTIVLRTEDDLGLKQYPHRTYAEELHHELTGRGFNALIENRPDVDWYIEILNEPNLAGMSEAQIGAALRAAIVERDKYCKRLSWLASMPTTFGAAWSLIASGATDQYDGLATHLYSWTNPTTDSGGGDWGEILNHLLTLDRGIWITELGIDDQNTAQMVKAHRILKWLARLPPRVVGSCLFAVGQQTQWPQYELTAAAADVYAARRKRKEEDSVSKKIGYPHGGKQRHYDVEGYGSPVISGPFLQYFDSNGGVRQFGFPLDDVQVEDGRPVQYFERAVMEYHPEADNPSWRVQLRRLGADAYDARYRAGS